jgi:hypothetical protein
MSEIIPVQNLIYSKNTFTKVVNTQFTELNVDPVIPPDTTVEAFFELYDELFTAIPKEGDIDSHRYILLREAEYLGVKIAGDDEVQALLQEITDLRQQLLQTEVNDAQAFASASIII